MSRPDTPPIARFRVQAVLYGTLAVFLVLGGVIYALWSGEATGTVLFITTGGFAAIVAGYLLLQDRLERTLSQAAPDGPESDDDLFLPHASIWPFEMGVGMSMAFTGIVLGWAFLVPGVLVLLHSIAGWIGQSRRRSSH